MAIIRTVVVNAEGPQGRQGDQGPIGPQGPPGDITNVFPFSGSAVITGSLLISGSNLTVLGSATATSFTGSLSGTSSWASNAITASFVVTAQTASYVLNAVSSSYTTYAVNGGVTQILAGTNITLSPTNGKGQVTITSTGGTGPFYNTATGSYGSFYDTTTQTNPIANIPRSMSFNTTAITNGVSISGSISPYDTFIKTENPGVYNIQFSAQLDKSDSGTDEVVIWLRKNGIDLIDTATTISLIGNNAKNVAAWNWFVNSAANDYYQLIWYSADTDLRLLAETMGGGHPGIPSVILTVNRVDQFLSNTGSFSGSFTGQLTGSLFGTSSWATNATSASYALTASYALNSTPVDTSALVTTSSFNTFTSSIQTQVNSLTAATSSYITTSQTSSMTVLSASFAATASYINPIFISASAASYGFGTGGGVTTPTASLLTTASFTTPNITFTKGDSTTFNINIAPLTSSLVQLSQTSSMRVLSSSFAATASLAPNYVLTSVTSSMRVLSSSFASTSSYVNTLNQTVTISGSTGTLLTINADTFILSGSLLLTGSAIITGSIRVSAGITGSLFGTSSWATNATTASYILNAVSSSFAATASLAPNYVLTSVTSSMTVLSSSFASTASLAPNYLLISNTSSMLTPYVLTSVTSSMRVASSSFAATASFLPVNTYSITSSYSVFAISASYIDGGFY